MKLRELAELLGGRVSGDPQVEITGVSGIKEAGQGDITMLADKKYLSDLTASKASAVIVKEEISGLQSNMLLVSNPLLAFARALEAFHKKPFDPLGVSDRAVVSVGVQLGKDISIYPNAFIGKDAVIGERVTLYPGVFIGEGSSIGDDSVIHPNVTIRENVKIGKSVIVHSGTVIGSDGFGYVFDGGIHHKILQVGRVIIEDDVEIGANVAIDRATSGDTVIGKGTKIDNLVHIAHNVKTGKNCIIAGQCGVSGSATLGEGVILAGQVGVRDHVEVGRGAMVGAKSGVAGDIPDGQIYSGYPAMPHKTWLRAQGVYAKLPEYIKRLHELERKINECKKQKAEG